MDNTTSVNERRVLVEVSKWRGVGVGNHFIPSERDAATAEELRKRGLLEVAPKFGSEERTRYKLTSAGMALLNNESPEDDDDDDPYMPRGSDPAINHPSYYGGEHAIYETIKVLEAWLSFDEMIGFLRGSAMVYMQRAGKKQGEDVTKDLGKAAFYTNYELDYRTRFAKGNVGEMRAAIMGRDRMRSNYVKGAKRGKIVVDMEEGDE